MTQNESGVAPSEDPENAAEPARLPYDKQIPYWMVFVVLFLTIVASIAFVYPWAGFRLGLLPEGNVDARGVAQIESCDRKWIAYAWNFACEGEVRWHEAIPTDRLEGTHEVTITSIRPLSGRVEVEQICRDTCDEIPADHPDGDGRGWLVLPGIAVMLTVGLVAGYWVAKGIGWIRYRRALAAGTS